MLLVIVCSCQSGKGKTPQPPVKDTVQKTVIADPFLPEAEKKKYHDEIDAFIKKYHFLEHLNGSILIAKNGVPVYEAYHGKQGFPHKKDSINADTPFQIASTSKPFTAAAVLQLIEQGKLSLSDTIQKFFPGFPYKDITIKGMLTHRSGLPNYLYYMDKAHWDQRKLVTNQEVLQTLMTWNVPKSYRPNVHFSYCNTNYVLLAMIVEKITGVPFPQYMKQNFFDKFGMTHTHIATIEDTTATLSYKANGGVWVKDYSDGPYGDKNVYSTPRDLLKWDQAWYNGLVVSPPMMDSAFKGYSNEKPSQHNYGLGWRLLFIPNGKKVVYHNGHWHGFNSAFARLTEEKATIIILCNKYNPSVYPFARALYNAFGNYSGKQEKEEE